MRINLLIFFDVMFLIFVINNMCIKIQHGDVVGIIVTVLLFAITVLAILVELKRQ